MSESLMEFLFGWNALRGSEVKARRIDEEILEFFLFIGLCVVASAQNLSLTLTWLLKINLHAASSKSSRSTSCVYV